MALRRALAGTGIRVFETRSRQECFEELARSPHSLVALELTASNAERVYQFLAQLSDRFPGAKAVILGQRGTEPFEAEMREAGAMHAVFGPRQLPSLAKLAQRHLSAAPVPEASVRQRILARLPWGD